MIGICDFNNTVEAASEESSALDFLYAIGWGQLRANDAGKNFSTR